MWIKAKKRMERFYSDILEEDYLEFNANDTAQVPKEVGEQLIDAYEHLFEAHSTDEHSEDEDADEADSDDE